MAFSSGDKVVIRGDKRLAYFGDGRFICQYTPDQLVSGKYVKNPNTGRVWVGIVHKVNNDEQMALVGGGWRGFEMIDHFTPDMDILPPHNKR